MERFLCDEMLARLCRYLRAAGYDAALATDGIRDRVLLQQCQVEARRLLKRYEKWKDIATLSGPPGLRLIKGSEEWVGYRSSRLGDRWRVVYKVVREDLCSKSLR